MTWILALWAKAKETVSPALASALAVAAALGTVLLAGRRQGRLEAQRDALISEQQARSRADEAAADAGRDGVDLRLRDGRF